MIKSHETKIDISEGRNSSTIIPGDANTSLSITVRTTCKKINEEIEDLTQ